MQLQRLCIVFLALVLLPGCTSTPSTPTSPGSTAASGSQSGWTLSGHVMGTSGAPVPGASVQYGGHQVQTNSAGIFSVTHQIASTSSLTLAHPSVLERRVWLNGGQSRTIALDPIALTAPFDLTFYRQMIRNGFDQPDALTPVRRLTTAPRFHIQTTDSNGMAIDAETVNTVIEGIREAVPQFTPFEPAAIETSAAARPPAQGWINVYFETRRPEGQWTCGTAQIAANPGWMRFWLDACRVSGDRGRIGKWIVMHEVGHAMGFRHTPPGHLMHQEMTHASRTITAKERFHAAIAYARPVGNMDPDTDPSSGAFSLAEAMPAPVVSCGLPGPTQRSD